MVVSESVSPFLVMMSKSVSRPAMAPTVSEGGRIDDGDGGRWRWQCHPVWLGFGVVGGGDSGEKL
jgi:hypothetical protein